jgi:hypothetical protein
MRIKQFVAVGLLAILTAAAQAAVIEHGDVKPLRRDDAWSSAGHRQPGGEPPLIVQSSGQTDGEAATIFDTQDRNVSQPAAFAWDVSAAEQSFLVVDEPNTLFDFVVDGLEESSASVLMPEGALASDAAYDTITTFADGSDDERGGASQGGGSTASGSKTAKSSSRTVVDIPEPSTIAIVALGLFVIACGWRRCERKRSA